jgi:hypothetical protein
MNSSSGFPKLQYLGVGTNYYENNLAGLAKLNVPCLSRLKLRGTLTVADAEVVAALSLDQLEELDLESTRIPARGLKAFANRGGFDEIRRLTLSGCELRASGIDALFQGEQLSKCESLDLSHNRNLREGRNPNHFMESLVGHTGFTRLARLHLCGLNSEDIRQLVDAKQFHRLELLELEESHIDGEGLASLARSPIGRSLRHLKLTGCDIAADSINHLKGLAFENLMRLDLGGGFSDLAEISEETVAEFLSSPAFASLQEVNLDFLRIRSKGLIAIAEKADLPELRQISYCNNHASRKSIDAVMNSPRLPKLAKLLLNGTGGLTNRERLIADYGCKVRI